MSDVEERRAEIGYRLSYKELYGPVLLILVPFLFLGILFNVLYYTLRVDPIVNLAVVSIGGAMMVVMIYTYYMKIAGELHGKKVLALTFRESRERVWCDFALIKEMRKVGDINRGNPEDSPIVPIEFSFEQFPAFEKMIALSPCSPDNLLDFIPDTMFWKGFLPRASVASLDVTRVKLIKIEDELIPVVVPTGCSFITENIQKRTRCFDVTKEDLDKIVLPGGAYDAWKSVETKELLLTREAELAAANASLEDFDKAVDERASAKVRAYLKTRKVARLPSLPRWIKIKKLWMVLGLIAVIVLFGWLMFGR